jgi:plastocyanin
VRKLVLLIAAVAIAAALAVPAFAATKTIKLADNSFSPKSLTVNKGTKLVFKWTGKAPHNVKGAGISSPTKTSGTFTARARKSGTIVCTIHPGMQMKLKVRR